MTSKEESKLSMYIAVKDFNTANATALNALPNYTANALTFQNNIVQLQGFSEQQGFDKTGIAVNKKQLRDNLINITLDNARRLTTYAQFTNNATLLNEISFQASQLKKLPDTILRDRAQMVYDRIQPIVATLATYLITPATQTALLAAITTYNNTIGSTRIAITTKSQATKQLQALFTTTDAVLNNLDAALEIVRTSNANLYNGYHTARKIVITGSGTLSVKGKITSNGQPLKGATVTFTPAQGLVLSKPAEKNLIKTTALRGGFNIKSLPEGSYMATISKPGYKDETVPVYITNGELTIVNTSLQKLS